MPTGWQIGSVCYSRSSPQARRMSWRADVPGVSLWQVDDEVADEGDPEQAAEDEIVARGSAKPNVSV